MRKILLPFLMLALIFSVSNAQKTQLIKLSAEKNNFQVTKLKAESFTLESSISDLKFHFTKQKEGTFVIPENPILLKSFKEGMPNIPVISKLIEVPQGADVKLTVKSFKEEIINLSDYGINAKIMPALRSQSKSEGPVPFLMKEEIYKTDDYFNKEVAVYKYAGQMRDICMGHIEINPIQYNPVSNTLRILNDLVIEVHFKNADFAKTKQLKAKYSSSYFNAAAAQHLINFNLEAKDLITQVPTHMVIVADRMFEAQLADYIAWKRLKGFKITEAYTDEIGTTPSAIKTYLQGVYQGSDPMTFVLFVGDVQQIPAWVGTSSSDHVTDLRYCEYTDDDIPEVFYGRFSAQNTAQLQPQIDKTLMYERYEMNDPSYLENFLLVAGDDESWEDIYGNGAIWYADNYYANEDNDITAHTFLQDPPTGNAAIHDSIIANVNAGVALANYTAHCSPSGWGTPSFQTGDVNGLTNNEKYGVWIGNCCLSVKFNENECFGEAALRKANGGAIGDIGGSNSTYWDEDFWWGVGNGTPVAEPQYENFATGAYDGAFHTLANEASDVSKWFTTQSQMVVCGNLAVTSSSSTKKQYYWEIYHLMGDPSLSPYLGVPDAMTVSTNPTTLLMGMTSLDVMAAPYAYVALSQNGTLIDAAMADASGNANLSFGSDAITVGNVDLVVTCQNKQPYIGTITVSPADKPYVLLNSFTTDIAPDFGQTVKLNVTLANAAETGSGYDASNVEVALSINDPYITIVDGTENFGAIAAGNTKLIDNAFSVAIANNVPDQHAFNFDLNITGEDGASQTYTWPAILNMAANAPVIKIGDLFVTNDDNADGRLDPGETGDINFTISNEGHAAADFSGMLSIINDPNNYLTLGNTAVAATPIAAGETQDLVFSGASADANTPLGNPVGLQINVLAGDDNQYEATKMQDIIIGIVPIYPISDGGTLTVCFGEFFDSGLEAGNYMGSEDYTMTFMPPANADSIRVNFTAFETEKNYDKLYVYDGSDVNAPQIEGSPFSGTTSPGTVMGANGLTFHFVSDGLVQKSGWVAEISCVVDMSTYSITFHVKDGANPLEGANINFYNMDILTDENGTAVFENIPVGVEMAYTVSKDGYHDAIGQVNVTDDMEVNVAMNATGINTPDAKISIVPNPNKGLFTLKTKGINDDSLIEIYSLSGKLILKKNLNTSVSDINLTGQANGIYFIKITAENKVYNSKLIIE